MSYLQIGLMLMSGVLAMMSVILSWSKLTVRSEIEALVLIANVLMAVYTLALASLLLSVARMLG